MGSSSAPAATLSPLSLMPLSISPMAPSLSPILSPTMSPISWLDMDYDLDDLVPSLIPWHNMSRKELSLFQTKYNEFKFYSAQSTVDLLVRTVLCLSGILGHIFTLIVLRDKEFQNGTFLLLKYISISDAIFCTTMWLMSCMEYRSIDSTSESLMITYTHVIKNVRGTMGYLSDLLSIALACDRLIAVWFFYAYSKLESSRKRLIYKVLTVCLLLGSVILQLGWSLSIEVGSMRNSRDEEVFVFEPRKFYLDGRGQTWEILTTLYYEAFQICFTFLSSVFTMLGMARLSKIKLATQTDKEQRKREFRTCFLSFFLCALIILWAIIDFVKKFGYANMTFMSAEFEFSNTYKGALEVLQSLSIQALLNFAMLWMWSFIHGSNFYLYLTLHRRFRRVFLARLCRGGNQVGPTGMGGGQSSVSRMHHRQSQGTVGGAGGGGQTVISVRHSEVGIIRS